MMLKNCEITYLWNCIMLTSHNGIIKLWKWKTVKLQNSKNTKLSSYKIINLLECLSSKFIYFLIKKQNNIANIDNCEGEKNWEKTKLWNQNFFENHKMVTKKPVNVINYETIIYRQYKTQKIQYKVNKIYRKYTYRNIKYKTYNYNKWIQVSIL